MGAEAAPRVRDFPVALGEIGSGFHGALSPFRTLSVPPPVDLHLSGLLRQPWTLLQVPLLPFASEVVRPNHFTVHLKRLDMVTRAIAVKQAETPRSEHHGGLLVFSAIANRVFRRNHM